MGLDPALWKSIEALPFISVDVGPEDRLEGDGHTHAHTDPETSCVYIYPG